MVRRTFLWLLSSLVIASLLTPTARAQTQQVDLYKRLIDPLAIARLDEPDFAPMRLIYGMGGGQSDPSDPGFSTFAFDSGQGVVTHLYVTSRTPDSLTRYHLFIDGSLYRNASLNQFFSFPTGIMRPPLDTAMGEARICDVQIPYHHGFKLNYEVNDGRMWYNYGWRPLPNASLPPSGNIFDLTTNQSQSRAEAVYRNAKTIWNGYGGVDSNFRAQLDSGASTTVLFLAGPSIVRSLRIMPDTFSVSLDSVWINIYYDRELHPSFSTPLLALFGQSYDFRDLHSLPIDFSRKTGFELRLPIPFSTSARIEFQNRSKHVFKISGGVTWFTYPVTRASFGYLCSHFSETNPTIWQVPHHVMNATGPGKYVGLLMGIHNLQNGATYEGDPIFYVDSNDRYSFHYDGLEDYFNGAQYFSFGEFFSPFGGTSNLYANYYRFHYLDEVSFRHSLDMTFEHGAENSTREHYRTLAFWYGQHCSFSADRDTVLVDEIWTVHGGGYSPGQSITLTFDSILVAKTQVDSLGSFLLSLRIPHLKPSFYVVRVNGEASSVPLFVSSTPALRLLTDPRPITLQTNDTLSFYGYGFYSGDSVVASFGGAHAKCLYSINSENRIDGRAIIPQVATGNYQLELHRSADPAILSDEWCFLTRTLRYEFEDLLGIDSSLAKVAKYLSLAWTYRSDWGHNAVAEFRPDSLTSHIDFPFLVPTTDTFQIMAEGVTGKEFGNYDVYLDGMFKAHFDGYRDNDLRPSDSINLGINPLTSGYHTVRFSYIGRDSGSTRNSLWADYMRLTPTTGLARLDSPTQVVNAMEIGIYPEPATSNLSITGIPEGNANELSASIADEAGRHIQDVTLQHHEANRYALDIKGLPSGLYWLEINTKDGKISKSFHIVH